MGFAAPFGMEVSLALRRCDGRRHPPDSTSRSGRRSISGHFEVAPGAAKCDDCAVPGTPVLFALALAATAVPTAARAPLHDRTALNIGLSCRWDQQCVRSQQRARRHALDYIARYHPPAWHLRQCKRNVSRGQGRVDWIGLNNCIRNPALVHRHGRRRSHARSEPKHHARDRRE